MKRLGFSFPIQSWITWNLWKIGSLYNNIIFFTLFKEKWSSRRCWEWRTKKGKRISRICRCKSQSLCHGRRCRIAQSKPEQDFDYVPNRVASGSEKRIIHQLLFAWTGNVTTKLCALELLNINNNPWQKKVVKFGTVYQ